MRDSYKYFGVLICLVWSISSNAQNNAADKVLSQVKQAYNSIDSYQIDVTYNMHQGLTGNTITESYDGVMKKYKNGSIFSVLGSKIYSIGNEQVTVNTKNKTLNYTIKGEQGFQGSLIDFADFLKIFNKTKVFEKDGLIICELVNTESVKQSSVYSKAILYIDGTTYLIKKQELFLSRLIPFAIGNTKKTKLDYARLIILLKHKNTKETLNVKLSDFITKNRSGKLIVSSKYNGYQLIN